MLCDVLSAHPKRAELQTAACHALVQLFCRQPRTAASACGLKIEALLLKALEEHGDSAEVIAEASTCAAWLIASHNDAAEGVALAGLAEAMMQGARQHIRIRPVQEGVCHALSQLFDENNALLSDRVRISALSLILELLRREPASAGTQMYASLALGNLCARHSGSARDAAMAGACELMLAAHRQHFQDSLVQGYCLLAVARIVESHPASAARAAVAGATPRFADALKTPEMLPVDAPAPSPLLDVEGMAHIAAALAQLYTLAIRNEPSTLPTMEALSELLQRYPVSAAGLVRARVAEALPLAFRTSPDDAALQAAASCVLGHLLLSQPHYAPPMEAAGSVALLLAALRMHPHECEVQSQASNTLSIMMQTLPSAARSIYEAGGDQLLAEAARLHPDSENLRVTISTAFRFLGKFVPELTPFPFVPAEPEE